MLITSAIFVAAALLGTRIVRGVLPFESVAAFLFIFPVLLALLFSGRLD